MMKKTSIAIISDQFLYRNLSTMFSTTYLTPENWEQEIKKNDNIELFLCESAWNGIEEYKNCWHHQIAWFEEEKIKTLKKIVKYCKRKKIPTVFYNKEDPVHFEKFLPAAKLFDYVFTTSKETINNYKRNGIERIYNTMFAVEPKIINPVKKYNRTDDITFAGSWFSDKIERCKEQSMMFDKIIESKNNLVFYNRQSESEYKVFTVPEKYIEYTKKSLTYSEIDKAYKSSKYGININTVKDSETMFSRRVFELLASGTYVFSNYSLGMEKLFGDVVEIVTDPDNLVLPDKRKYRNAILKGVRLVMSKHTYEKRMQEIFKIIGLEYRNNYEPIVNICLDTKNKSNKMIQSYNNINYIVYNDLSEIKINPDEFLFIPDFKMKYSVNYILDMILCYKYVKEDTIINRDYIDDFSYSTKKNTSIYNKIIPGSYISNYPNLNKIIDLKNYKLFTIPIELDD